MLCLAQGGPTAEQILDRYIETTGGKANYQKIKSETVIAVVEMKANGIKGRMTGYKNAKGETYNALEIDGVGKIEDGYQNGIAWENSKINGPRVKSGEEKFFVVRESKLAKDLHWRDIFAKVELAGEEVVDGVPCYKVVVTPKDGGRPETRFYEKQSGVLKKNTMIMATPNGDVPAESFFTNYREFNGVKLPTSVLTKMAGQEMTVSIASVDYTQDIPPTKFTPPAEILALTRRGAVAVPAKP